MHYIPEFLMSVFIMSFIAFLSFAIDKFRAEAGERRIKESHLLILSLVNGWPGALLASKYLRHKSQKRSFKYRLYFIVLVNVALQATALHLAISGSGKV